MVSLTLFLIWVVLAVIPASIALEVYKLRDAVIVWSVWLLLSLLWIVPIFSGVPVPNNEGQYKGYVTAVERNGAIFKGWNVFLKTDLQSSNEGKACIDRDNQELIDKLKEVQEAKENVTLVYEGVWQYKIGECPGVDWQVVGIKK